MRYLLRLSKLDKTASEVNIMSEEATVAEAPQEAVAEQTAEAAVAEAVASDRPEWLQSRYETEGRTLEEAIAEQAKGYNEIRGKLGAFTGSPDAYEPVISDELKEAGFELLENDPLIEQFSEKAKEMGINQEGFNQLLDIYATQQLAEMEAAKEAEPARIAEEMAKLGDNAKQRVDNVGSWVRANMSAEHAAGLTDIATSADAVMALEALIQKTRNAPQATATAAAPVGMTKDDALAMRYVKDDNGEPMMRNPEYARKANAALEAALGN